LLLFHFIILDSNKHYTAHTDEVIDGEILFLNGFTFVGFLFQRIEEVVICIGVLFIFLFLVVPCAVVIAPFEDILFVVFEVIVIETIIIKGAVTTVVIVPAGEVAKEVSDVPPAVVGDSIADIFFDAVIVIIIVIDVLTDISVKVVAKVFQFTPLSDIVNKFIPCHVLILHFHYFS